jgi:LysR family transcriptional regulator, nod-box dependent transcriptional activator
LRYQKLDLNLLVALDHLLRQRGVSAAAAEMHMTQSAMSNALARLRAYFGDELLVKVGRRLELTPRAEALKEPVREVLTRVDWTIATQPKFDPIRSDRAFNLLVSDYTLATLVPEILKLCRAASSRIRFNFLHQVAGPERLLDRGDLDLLIIPMDFASKRHPSEQILEEKFCAIAWSDGTFAKKKLTRKAFTEAGHVVMLTPDGAQSLESVFFRQEGVKRRIEVTTHSFTTIPALVSGSDRLATVHQRLAEQARRTFPIELLELPFRIPKMRQVMQWHKHRAQDSALLWLRSLIRAAAAGLG